MEVIFSFSVLWPIQDVHHGEECTRDFLFGVGEDKQRSARLTAWFDTPENYFIQVFYFFFANAKTIRTRLITSISSIGIQKIPAAACIKKSSCS